MRRLKFVNNISACVATQFHHISNGYGETFFFRSDNPTFILHRHPVNRYVIHIKNNSSIYLLLFIKLVHYWLFCL